MKPIIFLSSAILLSAFALGTQAHNHSEAVQRASVVVAADRAGSSTGEALKSLKKYVGGHTGSSVTLTLSGSYTRAQTAAEEYARSQGGTGQLYAEGQQKCAGKADSVVQARCVQSYVSQHLATIATPVAVAPPNPKDYIITIKSPAFASDFATLLFAGSTGLFVIAVYAFIRRKKSS
jgi:hypothetical protein